MHKKIFGLLIAVGLLLVSGASALADDKHDDSIRGSGRVVPVLPQ
jgi:hypothetical protein